MSDDDPYCLTCEKAYELNPQHWVEQQIQTRTQLRDGNKYYLCQHCKSYIHSTSPLNRDNAVCFLLDGKRFWIHPAQKKE
jgi:hypothetical protein